MNGYRGSPGGATSAHVGEPPLGELPLLERGRELATIESMLALARAGRGRIALLSGVSGVGKSRLLEEATARASTAGLRVLSCPCQPLERDFSLGVPLQLFERPWRERADRVADAAELAAPLFERGREPGEEVGPTGLFPLLHGLYWFVADVAAEEPIAIVIDDAQWADLSSLRFLNYLGPRIDDLAAALLISVRGGEAEGDRARLLAELESTAGGVSISLAPLSEDAVETVVVGSLPGATKRFCGACHRATGGNPLLLRELLSELWAEDIAPTDATAERISTLAPVGIRRTTMLRLARLGAGAVEVAKAVAVLEDDAEVRHVADLARIEPSEAADATQKLVAAGVFSPGERPAFAHPLLAAAVRSDITVPVREQMHLQVARRLDAESGLPERVAAHLLQATRQADNWVVETLRRAAAAALSRGSPDSAVRYLRRGFEEPAGGDARSQVMFELGEAQMVAGMPDAIETLEAARELTPTPDNGAVVLHTLGRALLRHGRVSAAAEAFRGAAAQAAGRDPELELQSEADFLQTCLLLDNPVEIIVERLPAAVARVKRRPRSAAERAILGIAALASVLAGQPHAEAEELAERAFDEGRLIAAEPADSSNLVSVIGALFLCDRYEWCLAILDQAMDRARVDGSVAGFAAVSYMRSLALLPQGRLADAIADAEGAVATGWEQYLPLAYGVWISALVERDELEGAGQVAGRFDDERWSGVPMYGIFLQALTRLALAANDPAAALGHAERSGAVWQMPSPAAWGQWRSLAARALTQLGERERAERLAAEELALVRPFGAPRALGVAMHALGLAQDGERGIATLREAESVLGRSEARLEHCRVLIDLGSMMRRDGRRADAREILRQGLEIAQEHGLLALERRAVEELKLAGGKPRSRYLRGVESLTPGELRVARMAADGMTNREIAQALFVTMKAVQYHLGNVYRKLDVDSRDHLPQALE